MAENEKFGDQAFGHERNGTRGSCRSNSEQRAQPRPSARPRKVDEGELPAPPPDPWSNLWPSLHNSRDQQVDAGRNSRSLDEDEDMIAYLTDDLGSLPPFEGRRTPSGCPSRNSAASAMAISSVYAEDAFEHLDRLYAFVDQILELRDRNAKFFKRVRNLERLKVLRDANQKLEYAFARGNGAATAGGAGQEEDTGFAESLLDAMLSNCRDSPFQRRGARSGPRQAARNNKLDIDAKQTSVDEISGTAPKVSKWTRVKAAFKWERAYTNDTENTDSATAPPSSSLPPANRQSHRSHDVDARESSNTATSSPVNENCNVGTPVPRTSSPSSSNDGFYDCTEFVYLLSFRSNISALIVGRTKERKLPFVYISFYYDVTYMLRKVDIKINKLGRKIYVYIFFRKKFIPR